MAAPVRLELTTLGLTVRCSTYWAKEHYILWSFSSTTTTYCVCSCESLTSPGSSSAELLYRINLYDRPTDWAKEQYFRLFLSNNRQKDGKWRCPILPVSVPTSTFGVRKLNFCVRYGNRWNLSAIITTMVIYQTIMVKHIQIMFLNTMYPFSEVILSLTLCLIYSASPPFKNFFLSISFPEDWQLHSKQFLVQTQISSCFHFISS